MQQNNKNNEPSSAGKKPMIDRRRLSPSEDPLYKVIILLNIGAWLALVLALVLFHFARPEFVSGAQKYWGIDGRAHWSSEHVSDLMLMLQVCLGMTLVSITLRSRRTRRKKDSFGANLIILLLISLVSLATLYTLL